jgi:hypothetical protein
MTAMPAMHESPRDPILWRGVGTLVGGTPTIRAALITYLLGLPMQALTLHIHSLRYVPQIIAFYHLPV